MGKINVIEVFMEFFLGKEVVNYVYVMVCRIYLSLELIGFCYVFLFLKDGCCFIVKL